MAYQSKYTGLQIDDILDSVEWKQGKIEDLASIRAGAAKGATALQSYTEKYTGTVTGIKINGVVKSGSGVIDLGTISTDISGKQDKLVDGVNIATINGQSLTAGGDLTIEGGAKVYTWNWDGSESGTLTQDEYDGIMEADVLVVSMLGMTSYPALLIRETEQSMSAFIQMVNVVLEFTFTKEGDTTRFTGVQRLIKTSQLVNDSNFVSSDGLKTINGESIVGSGNITISGGGSDANKIFMLYMDSVPGVGETGVFPISAHDFVDAIDNNYLFYVCTGTNILPCVINISDIILNINQNLVYLDITKNFSNDTVEWECYKEVYIQDKLVSGTNIKTINGTSILGSGDITISGSGASSGSGAYAEVNHGTSDTTFTLTPNTFHVWDEVSSLTLTLGSETTGVANEYLFQFTSGATATTLSLPSDLKWTEELVIESNRIYQVSILKGLASVLSWDNVTELVENKLEIVKSGKSYIINSQYPVESSLQITLSNSSISSIIFPAGSSSYSIGSNPTTPSIIAIEPSEDHAYKYIW